MQIEIKVLEKGDEAALQNVAEGVFDNPIDPELATEFLADSRHHLVVAIEGNIVVGMVSGVHYIHPDKPPELWINETGLASTHRRKGIGKRLLDALLLLAHELGCKEAWVLTDRSNNAAMKLYSSAGGVREKEETVMFTYKLSSD